MLKFRDFTSLNKSELEMILKWRNDTKITPFFINKSVEKAEHFAFVKALKKDKSKRYFLVENENLAIGVINFINITPNSAEFGLYQNPNLKGFGREMLNDLINFAFENLGIKTLKARAFNKNEKAIKLYLNFAFVIIKKDEKMTYFELKNEAYKCDEIGGGGFVFLKL